MRNLIVNKVILPEKQLKFDYNVETLDENENSITYKFTCNSFHGLQDGVMVTFEKNYPYDSKVSYPCKRIDNVTFSVEIPLYLFTSVHNYAMKGNDAVLEFTDRSVWDCSNNPEDEVIIYSMGNELKGKLGLLKDENGEYLNEEDMVSRYVVFDVPLDNIAEDGKINVLNTWFFKDRVTKEFDKDKISILENDKFLSTTISLQDILSYTTRDNDYILKEYLDDVTNNIIPEIIDNEKQQFIPVIAQGTSFKKAKEIQFNLHFRQRETDENGNISETFKTNDSMIWNGYKWGKEEKNIVRISEGYNGNLTDDFADELNLLGFTEDDIRLQKTKIKKSFIRLLFYSSKSLLSQELIGYSTIFMDAGKLYRTYSNIKNRQGNNMMPMKTFDAKRDDEELKLSASFNVKTKYDIGSSEGFYLYLFPDEIKSENKPQTIYMKVEFNHAGYGKTLTMMMPRGKDGFPLPSTGETFPVNFMRYDEKNGVSIDFNEYTDSVFIPLNIKYNSDMKCYTYWFPWFDRGSEDKITINLWEPRVKGKIEN